MDHVDVRAIHHSVLLQHVSGVALLLPRGREVCFYFYFYFYFSLFFLTSKRIQTVLPCQSEGSVKCFR